MIIRIAIVEDEKHLLNSLSMLLNGAETLEVVGCFITGEEALEKIPGVNPNVVIVDLGLPVISGIGVIKELKGLNPAINTLVHTVCEDKKHLFAALKAGASGYLLKGSGFGEMVQAIEEVHNGCSFMSPKVAKYITEYFYEMGEEESNEDFFLTERAKEILRGIADGLTDKKLAERLFISPHTVRSHIRKIYEKLHVHSGAEAVSKAMRKGLL